MTQTTARHDSDKRVIRTKKAIKAALFKLLEEKSLSVVTITELTQKANVNRRTFYTHYRNITDILNEIEEDLINALTQLLRKFDANDYKTSTYNLFMGLDELITVEFDFYFHLVRVDMRGTLMSRLKNVIKSTTDRVLMQVCPGFGTDVEIISSFIVGGFFNTYLNWHNREDRVPIEHAAELASSMVAFCVDQAGKNDEHAARTTEDKTPVKLS